MDNSTMNQSQNSGSKYWLSLDQWRQDPEFQKLAEQEFMSSPLQDEGGKDGWARREFLKLMGASIALTSFGCVRRPAQMIVPYAKKPKEIVHGLPNYYASGYVDSGEGFGILVTSREGRPVKIEGNEDHPINSGGMSARAHAHILSLYDPERLNGPRRNLQNDSKSNHETVSVKWEDLDKAVVEQLKKGGGALLMGSHLSPTTEQLVREFASGFNLKVYRWDSLTYEDLQSAQRLCYGKEVLPRYRFDKAQVIVSVGADFLGSHLTPTANARLFAKNRKPGAKMSRLVVFEPLMSLTGANADQRHRITPENELAVVMALIHEIAIEKRLSKYAGDSQVQRITENFKSVKGVDAKVIAELAADLWENRGKSLVVAGGWAQSEHSLALQIATNFLNSLLENDGVTVDHSRAPYRGGQGRHADLAELVQDLKSGKVKSLIVHGCNPGYAGASSGLVEALKKAQMVVYTGDRVDETGHFADYVAPDHHSLENWDDLEITPGCYTVSQPTIQPLYDTRAFQDSMIAWAKLAAVGGKAKSADNWYGYLRDTWKSGLFSTHHGKIQKDFDDFWIDVLHKGVFETGDDRQGTSAARSFNLSSLAQVRAAKAGSGYKLVLYSTVGLKDGTLANVSWLQEFPDPVTKICWDNYLTVSVSDAAREKWSEGSLVQITVGGKSLDVPVHIQPGQADGVLGLAVGYGRTKAGKVANQVGQNAFDLMVWKDGRALAVNDVAVKSLNKNFELACVQDHHRMEGRQIVVEATLADFMKNPESNIHRHHMITMWNEHEYPNNKWGMVIDLNTCTGCGSCMVACQSENNVPVVGKKYVLKGREMSWIRIDRYYVGSPEDPAVVQQPLVCMHCDNAPCETVCPVMATAHSDEGTNDMIYNRCVGTRYCSNNCPYKVRRFNWFNFNKDVEKPLNYAMNPEVTVRARGVMEKCTFCIHRIRTVKSDARLHDRQLKDGDVKTACQQSCPTNAIVFGDLNDPNSQVRKAFEQKNGYALLEELNAKPAVRYLSKIRNSAELKFDPGHERHGHEGKTSESREGHHS